ncbi:MAG TPA: hypothetical protein DEH22_10035 [Chloroflexi bacterium]|nr:hypothetical protein [Chloroflexota bacterium]
MPDEIVRTYLFDRPGHYQIRVVGALSQSWLDDLEGLEISTIPWESYPEVIQIDGSLADQTALAGLLDLLTDLGLVILTVERLEFEKESKP